MRVLIFDNHPETLRLLQNLDSERGAIKQIWRRSRLGLNHWFSARDILAGVVGGTM